MNEVARVVGAIGLGLRQPRANRRRLENGLAPPPRLAEGAEQLSHPVVGHREVARQIWCQAADHHGHEPCRDCRLGLV